MMIIVIIMIDQIKIGTVPRHAEDDHADPHTQDPARRWSCEQLLMHQFFKSFSFKLPDSEEEVWSEYVTSADEKLSSCSWVEGTETVEECFCHIYHRFGKNQNIPSLFPNLIKYFTTGSKKIPHTHFKENICFQLSIIFFLTLLLTSSTKCLKILIIFICVYESCFVEKDCGRFCILNG